MQARLVCVFGGILVALSCDATKTPVGDPGGGGAGGTTAGTTGSGGGNTGSAGTGGAAMVACLGASVDNSNPGAIANPADFSSNSETGGQDAHTLWMGRADMVRRVLTYTTAGPADHKHSVRLTETQLDALLGGATITVSTDGPPLNASTGHSHMITIRPCGITPGFGGAGGGATTTTGGGGSSGTTTATLVDCNSAASVGAIANPVDFSVNPDTGAFDMHMLSMYSGDLSRGQSNYKTGGPADHQHAIVVEFEQRTRLLKGESVIVTTQGPPLEATSGHGHTIKITGCAQPVP
jgi:hypothetical protein